MRTYITSWRGKESKLFGITQFQAWQKPSLELHWTFEPRPVAGTDDAPCLLSLAPLPPSSASPVQESDAQSKHTHTHKTMGEILHKIIQDDTEYI